MATCDIATQIRARIDAIAAERLRLDDEERRLKKALDALEETTATSEAPGLSASDLERLKKAALLPDLLGSFAPEVVQCRYVPTCHFPINQQGPAY